MKLISKDLLIEYGFKQVESELKIKGILMTRDKFTVTLMEDGECYYRNLGIDYPLRDLAALKKIYKEAQNTDLIIVV